MNQTDKEYLQSQGFLDEEGMLHERKIRSKALLEAMIFAGALLENKNDLCGLQTVLLYIKDTVDKKKYAGCHKYVQLCYKSCSGHGELDGFYTASLDEHALKVFAIFFCVYLELMVYRLREMQLGIELN